MRKEDLTSFNLAKDINSGSVNVDNRRILEGPALSEYLESKGPAGFERAFAHWEAIYNSKGTVPRAEIDPVALGAEVLPQVVLIDVIGTAPRRFRYRLVGSAAERIYGENYAGHFMDEMGLVSTMKKVMDFYDAACESGRPVLLEGEYVTKNGVRFRVVRLTMPLSEGSDGVTGLFCMMAKID